MTSRVAPNRTGTPILSTFLEGLEGVWRGGGGAGRLMKSQRAGQDWRLGAADQPSPPPRPGPASLSPGAGPHRALSQEGVRAVLLPLPAWCREVGPALKEGEETGPSSECDQAQTLSTFP